MFLLLEVAVHLRHLRNIFLIREIQKHGGADGQISYQKWFSYRVSAFELYLYFGLFLIDCRARIEPILFRRRADVFWHRLQTYEAGEKSKVKSCA